MQQNSENKHRKVVKNNNKKQQHKNNAVCGSKTSRSFKQQEYKRLLSSLGLITSLS